VSCKLTSKIYSVIILDQVGEESPEFQMLKNFTDFITKKIAYLMSVRHYKLVFCLKV